MSHPSRVRGSKLPDRQPVGSIIMSHPSRVRGSKQAHDHATHQYYESHPSRVRGSKRPVPAPGTLIFGRTHHGCVDRNSISVTKAFEISSSHPSRVRGSKPGPVTPRHGAGVVAPITGAWIETTITTHSKKWRACRTHHGCVDRNLNTRHVSPQSLKSHPSRVRGSKQAAETQRSTEIRSHPSRVRGSKLAKTLAGVFVLLVAPITGAWIETCALHMG